MSYRFVTCNVQKPDNAADNRSTVATAIAAGDVVGFNEANDAAVIGALRELPEQWRRFIPPGWASQNPIVWNTDVVRMVPGSQQSQRIMTGLKVGKRRLGPHREASAVLLEHNGKWCWHVQTHLVSGAHSFAKWRVAYWLESVRALGDFVVELQSQALAPVVLSGDFNTRSTVKLAGLKRVTVPPTLGKSRYEHIYVSDGVTVAGVQTVRTKSDHLAVACTVRVDGEAEPTPIPEPEPVPVPEPEPVPVVAAADRVIAIARAEIGVKEGRSNGRWNNDQKYSNEVPGLEWSDFQPWCATFVSWVAMKAGVADLYPRTASCDVGGNWFRARKRWSEYPAIGAQVFYGTPRDLNHTGIVVAYDADTITTVEGNTNTSGSREGDGVYLKKRRRRDAHVVGYGYPAFPEGIVSADPAWRGKPTTPKPPTNTFPRIDGVDISHWQSGPLDFVAAKGAGAQFVIHKATERLNFRDKRHDQRRKEVAAAGLPWGAYHFARPAVSSGRQQARFFLSVAKPVKGDLRPTLDLEDRGGLTVEQLTRWTEDFVDEVKKATGKPPILYTNFDLKRDPGCFLWVARYNNANAAPRTLKPWKHYTIWQFSNGVHGRPNHVPGLGNVDINTLRPGFDIRRLIL